MSQAFISGDFLVFQLESGFGLLRLLAVEETAAGNVWHLAAYGDFFPDVDTAEKAAADPGHLTLSSEHMALTNRAFQSTQVAKVANIPITAAEQTPLETWRNDPDHEVSDRSVRLMLGLR